MKKMSFVVVGAAALALASCGGKQENAVENVDENVTENLEAASNEAATINETDTLANQEDALNAEAAQTPADDADAKAANVNAM